MAPLTRKRRAEDDNDDDDVLQVACASTKPTHIEKIVEEILKEAGMTQTQTKGDWCLKEGLVHVCSVDDGRLLPLLQQHGPPTFYSLSMKKTTDCRHCSTTAFKTPSNTFQSLCRIVAGQQLAGTAAQAIWKRLLETTGNNLTPETILSLASTEHGLVQSLQKPAGLSLAKARSIVDISKHFQRSDLTQELLTTASDQRVREALLRVKGLGPWSCDMFSMFTLEKSNILPIGDFGVRKGMSRAFSMRGSAKGASLCPKKDLERIQAVAEPFAPYQSLFAFYMWKAADTVDFYNASPSKSKRSKTTANAVTP